MRTSNKDIHDLLDNQKLRIELSDVLAASLIPIALVVSLIILNS